MVYRLTQRAEEDIIRIFREGVLLFGAEQAERYHADLEALFRLIADNPRIAREREEITPPVRIHPHKAHLIVYLIEEDSDVLIVRVRHGHEDWENDPV